GVAVVLHDPGRELFDLAVVHRVAFRHCRVSRARSLSCGCGRVDVVVWVWWAMRSAPAAGFAEHAVDDGFGHAQVRAGLEQPCQPAFADRGEHARIGLDRLADRHAVALAGLGELEDDFVGAVLAQGLGHFEHERFHADRIAEGLGVALHPRIVDGEAGDGVGEQADRHQRVVRDVGDRAPFQAGAAVVAFVFEDHRVQRQHHLGLGQPRHHHHLLAAFRVAFVRHGAAADL
ncbi:hypothetical protein CATMIT_01548, partial [Catenibacterium mitsuokai DSM 15897]